MANTYNVTILVMHGDMPYQITGNDAIKAIADYKAHNFITVPVSEGEYTLVPFHAVITMAVTVSSGDEEEIVDAFCVQDGGSDEGGDDEGGGGSDEGGGGDDEHNGGPK